MMRKSSLHLIRGLGFGFAFLAAFAGSFALAQPAASSAYRVKKNVREDVSGATLGFSLSAISYSSESAVDSSFQQKAEMKMRFKKDGMFFGDSRLTLGTFSEPQSMYYDLPEAYLGYGDKYNAMTAGRKHETLSFADSFFNFGLIQGHASTDNINFSEGGLTGAMVHYYSGSFGFKAAYMPIFIPNQGPSVKAEDGKIVSSNRWASQPPESFKFGEENKEIIYAIRDYNITDIVANSGYMATAFAGGSEKRPLLQLTYAYKPINELALMRDTFSDITTFKGYVYLTPVVLYHQVGAADLNIDFGKFKSTLSALADQPENKKAIELEAMQTLSPLSIISAYASYDMSTIGRKLEVYVAAAKVTGGEIKDVHADGREASFSFSTSRTQFKNPVRTGIKSDMFYIYNEAVNADVNFTYDQELKGSLLSMLFKYRIFKTGSINMGADLIGMQDDQASSTESNFLAQNRANDRIFGGLTYVF
jgi:hypothetical protein